MERFEYVTSLGEGAYGTVWLCKNRDTNQKVAMKRFKDAHVDPEVMRLALREIRLLKASQHKNVVQLLEAFRSKSGRVYIVMEYVERTLTQDLRKFNRGFPPLLVKMVTWQLLQAVSFLHRNRVIHRDLKPANILLTGDNVVKLCDFGFARTMHPQEVADYTTYVVTRWYRPPEVLVSDEYGPKVDVWAIGCLFSEMASGRPLFPGKTSADQLWLTLRTLGPLPPRQAALMAQDPAYAAVVMPGPTERTSLEQRFPQFTPDMMSLLRGCLALDPDQRLTADEALAAPYFADVPQIQAAMDAAAAAGQEFWPMVEAAWRTSLAAAAAAAAPRAQTPVAAAHPATNSSAARTGAGASAGVSLQGVAAAAAPGPRSSFSTLMAHSASRQYSGTAAMPSYRTEPNQACVGPLPQLHHQQSGIQLNANTNNNPLSASQSLHLSALISPNNGAQTPNSCCSVASRMTAPMAPPVGALQRNGFQQVLSGEHYTLARCSSTGLSETTTLTVMSGSSLVPGLHRTLGSDGTGTLHELHAAEQQQMLQQQVQQAQQMHFGLGGGLGGSQNASSLFIAAHARAAAARSLSNNSRRPASDTDALNLPGLSHGSQPNCQTQPMPGVMAHTHSSCSYSGSLNVGTRSRLSMMMPTITSSVHEETNTAPSTRSAQNVATPTAGRSTCTSQTVPVVATVGAALQGSSPTAAACDVFVTDKEKGVQGLLGNGSGLGFKSRLSQGSDAVIVLQPASDGAAGDKMEQRAPAAQRCSTEEASHLMQPQHHQQQLHQQLQVAKQSVTSVGSSGSVASSSSSKPSFFKELGAKFERMFSSKEKEKERDRVGSRAPSAGVNGVSHQSYQSQSTGGIRPHVGPGPGSGGPLTKRLSASAATVLPPVTNTSYDHNAHHGGPSQSQQGFRVQATNGMRAGAQGQQVGPPSSSSQLANSPHKNMHGAASCHAAAASTIPASAGDVGVLMRSLSSRQLAAAEAARAPGSGAGQGRGWA